VTRVWAIATNTFREAVRDKVLHSILFVAALMLLLSLATREIAIGDTQKVVRGVALGSIGIVGAIIAVFLGVGLVWKEIDRKTVYTLASKPIARWQLLLGKYLGLWITLAVEIAALALLYTLCVGSQQGLPGAPVYVALGLLMVELTLVCAWATLFSTFAAPTTASAYTVSVWLIGHFADDLRLFGEKAESEAFRSVALALYRVVPNLSMFNVRTEAVHGIAVPTSEILAALAYGGGYTVIVLAVAMWAFERRDFT
jgi:ABC-type transport system involved in multi-copper enzyme maturation permease subunit